MLDFKEVSFAYPHRSSAVQAVEGITFGVEEGTLTALTGPSGCGKSTLLRLASGLLSPDKGEVLLEGKAPDPKAVSIGFLSQQYGLLDWETVRQNILLPYTIRQTKPAPGALEEIAETLSIAELLGRYPHELSGGQRQRVALARVFLQTPRLLLLDEPFAALDILTAEKSRALFREIWDRHRVTTLLVTHNPQEAVTLASRVLLMSGTAPGHLKDDFRHPDEAALRQALSEA